MKLKEQFHKSKNIHRTKPSFKSDNTWNYTQHTANQWSSSKRCYSILYGLNEPNTAFWTICSFQVGLQEIMYSTLQQFTLQGLQYPLNLPVYNMIIMGDAQHLVGYHFRKIAFRCYKPSPSLVRLILLFSREAVLL